MDWWGYSVGPWWSSQLRGEWNVSPGAAAVPALFCSSFCQMCFPVSASLSDGRTLKDSLTVFCFVFLKKEKRSISVPRSEKWAWRADKVFLFFLSQWDSGSIHHPCQWPNCALAWVTTDTSAENTPWNCVAPAPSGPSAPPSSSSSSSSHLHSFPFCSLPGLHVSGTASPSRPTLASFFFFASFSYSCQLVSTGTWAQTSEALSLTMTPVLRAVCFKVPL